MVNRKMLYGYKMDNGDIVIHREEESIVRRAFTGYLAGLSYQKLADSLNTDHIPYCQEAPEWNKHKVKRILENPRYTGRDGYPPMIDVDIFRQVQSKISEKSAGQVSRRTETDALWPKLRSGCCHARLLRLGGKSNGLIRLKCDTCNAAIAVRMDELLAQTARQLAEHDKPESKPYAPSAEVIRLANAIDRTLEQPTDGMDAVALILQGASARYDCCESSILPHERDSTSGVVDWGRFAKIVSHITIEPDQTITLHF